MFKYLKKIKKNGFKKYLKRRYLKNFLKNWTPKYHKVLVHEQSLLDILPAVKAKIDINLRFVNNVKEIENLIKQREHWYHVLAEKRFREQALCYIAETDNKIVGCMWIEFRDHYIPEIEYTLKIDKGSVFSLDGWTAPDFRGLNIFPYIRNELLKKLKEQGNYKRVIGVISLRNINSLRVQKKLDSAQIIMTISLIKIFGIKKHRKKSFPNISFRKFC